MKLNREDLFTSGLELMKKFCILNRIQTPKVYTLLKGGTNSVDRFYYLNSCAFYNWKERAGSLLESNSICIMVDKCARIGTAGRLWSYPGYVIDRTPYGVLQHELGHAVDHFKSFDKEHFAEIVWKKTGEDPLTGYLGKGVPHQGSIAAEWFAEIFRLFVTNPDLLAKLRPRTYNEILEYGLIPCENRKWDEVLKDAPQRTIDQANKKIEQV